jgi:acrylyl-CoA reductase (NADPH)
MQAWELLARQLDKNTLQALTTEIGLGEVIDLAPQMLAGKLKGRIVIDVNT